MLTKYIFENVIFLKIFHFVINYKPKEINGINGLHFSF